MVRPRLFPLAILFCLFAFTAFAQITGGSVVGVVSDNSTAVVVGAKVVAANLATNQRFASATNERGYYEFPLLPPGRYQLSVEFQGFQPARSEEFVLNAGTRPRLDFTLNPAGVQESIQVTATAPLVNATTTDLGVVVGNTKIEALPLNGRNFQQLVGLQAGVVNEPSNALGGRGGIEFNGSPAYGNNLLLDGVDMSFGENNATASDTAAGAAGGSLINTVSVEAIEEFKATGSAFSAEYGRATGGVLNVTTKRGTNQFHGTLFEFFRNDALDANSFFSNRSGLTKPPLRWNQFGGNLGGPVLKDKLFFFFNYEGAVVRRARQIVGNVPAPLLLGRVPAPIRENLSGLPTDFTPSANPLIGLHRRNAADTNDEHTTVSRGDYRAGQHQLSARFSYNHQDYSQPNLRPANRMQFPNRFHNGVFQDAWTISPSMFNEARFGVNRVFLDRTNTTFDTLPGWVEVSDVGLASDFQSRIYFQTKTYTIADNFTSIRGNHTIKAGMEIRVVDSFREQGTNPTYFYNNLNDLIADRPNRIRLVFGGGKPLDSDNYSGFIQDDWRINRKLQLNLGLRYEYYTPLKGGFNVTGSDPFGPFGTNQEPMFAPDRNNFGPRLGVVYDPFGNQKLVVRAGGGISSSPPQPFFYYALSFIDPRIPFNATFAPSDFPPSINLAFPFPKETVNRIAANPSLLPPDFVLGRAIADYYRRDEYAGQWNFSLQYAVTRTLAAQASYVGSRGLKLYSTRNPNEFNPRTGQRPRPELGQIGFRENAGRSAYNAMQLSLNQRLNRGLTLDAYYTFARATAYYGADGTQTEDTSVQDPDNIAGSMGPKIGEVRHRFVSVFSYALPSALFQSNALGRAILAGWVVQGIVNKRSGLPVNPLSGVDLAGNRRVTGQRPDFTASSSVPIYADSPDRLLFYNRAAFDNATPQRERRFGNAGFNSLRGPGTFGTDLSIHKTFAVKENHRVIFRFEMFNALNHVAFGVPNATVSNPNFGRILSGSGGRNIQFALKYAF